ncbi:MAG: recombinase family protein [Candidatus Moraniibacteriota bacterium]
MEQKTTKLRYILYARKSSESEDRQVQSIDDQVDRLKKLADEMDLNIKKVYTEAKSAKKPNNRPLFDEMIEKIEKGEADGILCWQINRLSRNPVDSGKLSWMLQRGILKSIQTIDKQYLPEDNVIVFAVESGTANQFILDLSKNVKRGNQRKVESGWKCGLAPAGYKNDLYEHIIVKDTERFNLIRKAWDLMLTGNYTVPMVLNKLNTEWGYISIKRKGSGGVPLAMSGLYKIFTNIFYTGMFSHNGQLYQGKHESMVTFDEYDKVQIILGRAGKPRPKTHKFAFTGMIRCGECGCFHTAEHKTKIIKSTGELKKYTYYHCTRRKVDIKCSQRKVLSEDKLEDQIEDVLDSYTILPEFRDWALEVLATSNDIEIEDRTKIYEMQHKSLVNSQEELDELTKMRYRKLIDDEAFLKEKEILQKKIAELKSSLRKTENRAENWLELTERTFNFATYAQIKFGKGTIEEKKEILSALCSNPIIKDQKLAIQAEEWFETLKNGYKPLLTEYLRLELDKKPLDKVKSEALTSLITRWHGM